MKYKDSKVYVLDLLPALKQKDICGGTGGPPEGWGDIFHNFKIKNSGCLYHRVPNKAHIVLRCLYLVGMLYNSITHLKCQ